MITVERRVLCFVFLVGVLLPANGGIPGVDCNRNGIEDVRDIECGGSEDCNENAVPDECDVFFPKFEARGIFPVSEFPRVFQPGDFDGDGDIDLVTGNRETGLTPRSTVSVLLNDGGGEFADNCGESGP